MLAYETFQYACREKGIGLHVEKEDKVPRLYADERMLSQIIDNLVSNAIKFTPNNGKITIALGKTTSADGAEIVVISVSDTGIGVPEHLRERIFESYYQADSGVQRQYKGTGLGLSISRKMAELHHGKLVCESSASGGTRLVLTIPAKMNGKKRILLVSNAHHSSLDLEILAHEFNVTVAEPKDLTMENILKYAPNMALLDYNVGQGEAIKIASLIKQFPQTTRLPVIFIGKDMEEKEKVWMLKTGAADVISRPYTAGEFLARIKRAFGEVS
jgi:CheY-like chemotaxis protein